jgi:hypothetical protein
MEPEGSLPCSQKPATGPYPVQHSWKCINNKLISEEPQLWVINTPCTQLNSE